MLKFRIYQEMPYKRILFVPYVLIAAFIILIAGCSESTTGVDDIDEPGENEVVMSAAAFSPQNLQVVTGTTVTWINQSSEIHTVTSGSGGQPDGRFNSGNVPPGGEYTFTFTEAGSYPYYCIPHVAMGMTGTVTVIDDDE